LLIHFPIALLIAGALVDLVDTLFGGPSWLAVAGTGLCVLGTVGAVAAVASGQQAADTVFMPGMAYPVVAEHRMWALATTSYFSLVSIVRVGLHVRGVPIARLFRGLLMAAALIGVVALQQTAERGARLVYEYGVGVIGSGELR
jgi:uncharacterized membrane protein